MSDEDLSWHITSPDGDPRVLDHGASCASCGPRLDKILRALPADSSTDPPFVQLVSEAISGLRGEPQPPQRAQAVNRLVALINADNALPS